MRNTFRLKWFFLPAFITASILLLTACNLPGNTRPAASTEVQAVTADSMIENPTATLAPPPPVTATVQPATATPTPAHVSRPDMAPTFTHHLWDADSSKTASKHYPPNGDNFAKGVFERPFNANTQDKYFPEVDILDSNFLMGSPWVYANIVLAGPSSTSNKLDASYAIDLSLNQNGYGDYFILVNQPGSGGWSTDGVQVWQDVNHDVDNPSFTPQSSPAGDGYELLVFDQGKGNDPDLAWAMVDPSNPNMVWVAFKSSLIQDSKWLLRRSWAQRGGFKLDQMNYYQHMTEKQAGNPMPKATNYPLKDLSEMDNTCRIALNYTPAYTIPGLCIVFPTAAPPGPNNNVPNQPQSPGNLPITHG